MWLARVLSCRVCTSHRGGEYVKGVRAAMLGDKDIAAQMSKLTRGEWVSDYYRKQIRFAIGYEAYMTMNEEGDKAKEWWQKQGWY